MTLASEKIASLSLPGKIVVATDLTDTDYLLPHAVAQAKASKASLILVHAVLPHEAIPMEAGAIPYYDPLRMDRDARLLLENLARDIREQGVDCITAVRHGFVPDVVTELVSSTCAGRLIAGTHGRRGLKRLVLGSVARQLLEVMEIPVCTVGPRAHKGTRGAPTRILHPVSLGGSHETSAALSLALGQQFGAEVVLLHVIAPGPGTSRDPGRPVAEATEALERLVPREARERTQVLVRIALGTVVSEILSIAEEKQADLIVLGVHAPAHSWLPGTEPAAYRILVSAPCPVISLRADPELKTEQQTHKDEVTPVIG